MQSLQELILGAVKEPFSTNLNHWHSRTHPDHDTCKKNMDEFRQSQE